MSHIDVFDRRALGILSSAMDKQLGISNLVSREVNRAFKTGQLKDRTRASLLFDSLPRWQRIEVQKEADDQAYKLMAKNKKTTARKWGDLSNDSRQTEWTKKNPPRLPTFLLESSYM